MKSVQYIPRATEKAYNAQTQNKYVFYVPKSASKQAIAKAIAEAFKVTVVDVQVLCRKGKATRFSRGKHAYPGITLLPSRPAIKSLSSKKLSKPTKRPARKLKKLIKRPKKSKRKLLKKSLRRRRNNEYQSLSSYYSGSAPENYSIF